MVDSATNAAINTGSSRETPSQVQRLVDWNSEVLLKLLKQVVAKRNASGKRTWDDENLEPQLPNPAQDGSVVLDEVTDIIDLPGFEQNIHMPNSDFIELTPAAVGQLKEFVKAVANAYHSNPFHCLQHASQVSMAVTKLLSRIIVKDLHDVSEGDEEEDSEEDEEEDVKVTDALAGHLHNHTYGITSDPLTQFTLVLSAFVHAVDHRGVTNEQITKEEPDASATYKNRSITEQRSVDKVWKKLMGPEFVELRKCIYGDVDEKKRFRQVLVNSVLATDIDDEELQTLRMKRWEATFQERRTDETSADEVNRKATIVIEHLMQSADIFHFMQPWIIYEKWSSRQFEEMYVAFKAGRSETDPSTKWYMKELQFFDNYVVPLAMQLKDCDAFVVGSDEFLNYALKNRRQFAGEGKEWVSKVLKKLGAGDGKSGNAGRLLSPVPVSNGDKVSRSNLPAMDSDGPNPHIQRLVEWNVEMLQRLLKQIIAKRAVLGQPDTKEVPVLSGKEGKTPLDDMTDAISLADFETAAAPNQLNPNSVELSVTAVSQLRDYVTDISRQFRHNPFHCLDRGSQVCMSARKSITRLINASGDSNGVELHNNTFGISSDPLAQFALVFAALINNVGHNGLPNSQLVREEDKLATKYKGKSVLEQNSIDIAFNHLMRSEFDGLRACIYANDAELKRFRQVVVHSVLATDCTNDELIALRKARFEKAFGGDNKLARFEKAFGGDNKLDVSKDSLDLKGTVALEMLMASSDIFHATQSWQVYQKWNERHFQEMYTAFQIGRLRQDPSVLWFKHELMHFDDHVIPLAKSMSEGGLFGVSGDEILGFALSNRQQWAAKGGDLVASMMARYHGKEVEKVRARRRHRRMSLTPQQA